MMMIPSERLKGIEAFVCAADTGSFTAAAARLNLTISAVSKGIARLESRLGTRLFERTTRSLALTDAGAAFYATCVRVLAELTDAEAVLATHRSAPAGRLKIDLPIAYGRMRVMPLILEFADRYPDLRPHISFTDRFTDIIEERIDIAVRIGASDLWPPALGHHHVGTERVVFCAAPGYLERRGAPATADELADHDCILYGRADGSITWRFRRAEGQVERRPIEGRIVLGSAEAQVGAVVAGCGIAQLATWLIKDRLSSGELVEILPDLATSGLPLEIVWPRSRQLLPKVDALVRLLSERLSID